MSPTIPKTDASTMTVPIRVGSGSRYPTMRMPHSDFSSRVCARRVARAPVPTIRIRRNRSPRRRALWKYQTMPSRMATRIRTSRAEKMTTAKRLTY